MGLYIKILILTLINQVVTREALLSIQANSSSLRRAVAKAIESGHLREIKIQKKAQGKRITNRYYLLTPNGLRYLISDEQSPEWIKAIDLPKSVRTRVFKTSDASGKKLISKAKISEAKILCEIAGAQTPLLAHGKKDNDDNDTGNDYISIIKSSAKMTDELLNENIINVNRKNNTNSDLIRFTDKYRVIEKFLDDESDSEIQDSIKDWYRARMAGILDSRNKNLIIYTVHDIDFTWTTWTTKSDIGIVNKWNSDYSISTQHDIFDNPEAILLVKSKNQFERIYSSNPKLHEGIDHLYVVPKSYIGTKQIELVATEKFDDFISYCVAQYSSSAAYAKSDGKFAATFPLLYNGNTNTAVGLFLDIKQIRDMSRIIDNFPDEKYAVICLEWQTPYYRSVFPNIRIIETGIY